MKTNKKISIEMTQEEYAKLIITLGVCQDFEHLFDGIDRDYMNKFGDVLDILLDIINCEGKFSCDKTEV